MLFENEHRLGSDRCAKDARERQNDMYNDYLNYNYFNECKDREKLKEFASDNHLVYQDGYGSVSKCTVKDDSDVRYGWEWTNMRGTQQLNKRVFTAVPNLGRGVFDAGVEGPIRPGEDTNTQKSCDPLSESSVLRYVMTPMLPCVREVQNPDNIVPSWTWGGENTRDTVNQEAFLEGQGYAFDGNVWRKKLGNCN